MELRQLKYFIGIVDAGSLTRAAQHLHVAQPALSAQIVNLESELGVQLLVRSVRGVTCTDAGATFYKHARHVLRTCAEAVAATRSSGTSVAGTVSLGLPSSVCARVGVPLIASVLATHPNIRIQLTDSPSAYLTELLMQGRMDLGVLFAADPVKGVVTRPLFTESLVFVRRAGTDTELAASVRLRDIAQERLVLPVLPNALRVQVDAAFAGLGLQPSLVAEVSSMEMLAQSVASGLATTINSWSGVANALDAGLVTVHDIVEPAITRTLALCQPDVAPLSPASEVVHDRLRGLFLQLVEEGTWRGARWIEAAA